MGNTTSSSSRKRPSDEGDATVIHGCISTKRSDENTPRAPNGRPALNGPAAATPPEMDVTKERKKAKHSHNFASGTLEAAVFDFFTAPAITEKDLEDQGPRIKEAIEKTIDLMESEGASAYLEYKTKQKEKKMIPNKKNEKKDSCADEEDKALGDSLIGLDPRSYQTALLEIAKQQNTIVHLGTGSGKTLIALLLIKHFAEEPTIQTGKQIVFLVPTVALALQHHSTISANLPYKIGLVHGGQQLQHEESREQLSRCEVIIATHGACLDMLLHYGDLISVKNWKLLILDECHNCTGDSPYNTIMQNYHETPMKDRPRVLGLTASPLINVKKGHSDAKLQKQLTELEMRLDSRIVSLESWNSKEGDDYRRRFTENEAKEIVIHYDTMKPRRINAWPQMDQFAMHVGRRNECQQFMQLYEDVGPFPTALYARQLVQDLATPNAYEGETEYELTSARHYLRLLIAFCEQQDFRLSHKLSVLEDLLFRQLLDQQAVGVVFVQRRITALALHLYFSTMSQMDSQERVAASPLRLAKKEETGLVQAKIKTPGIGLVQAKNYPDCPLVSPHFESIGTFNSIDQFDDAEMDEDPSVSIDASLFSHAASNKVFSDKKAPTSSKLSIPNYDRIKTGVLVRNPRQLFKSLSFSGSTDEKAEWIHQQRDICKVIKDLRSGGIRILIGTSLIEEGIDVQACSFVVVFDGLVTLKSYVQMKGRARRDNANFFVFQSRDGDEKSLTLADAQASESRVRSFLSTHLKHPTMATQRSWFDGLESETLDEEILAVRRGFYAAAEGKVLLQSAKSLLYRYSLRQPMDPMARKSKAALQAHLPFYDGSIMLRLPAFIENSLRDIRLPPFCLDKPKNEKENILALMAVVRLHKNRLLSERLLPLTPKCIRKRILSITENNFDDFTPRESRPITLPRKQGSSTIVLHQYAVDLKGGGLEQARRALRGEGNRFALLVKVPFENISIFEHHHPEFGLLTCRLEPVKQIEYSITHIALVSDFFAMIFNARWKRRSRDAFFGAKELNNSEIGIIVGLLDKDGELDVAGMQKLLKESKRSHEQMLDDAQSLPTERLQKPRLRCPIYDQATSYIVYGPTRDKTADSEFPADNALGVKTYKEYFSKRWEKEVPGDSPLYMCQRLWKQPRTSLSNPSIKNTRDHNISDGYTLCDNLSTILLPNELCMEAHFLANAAIALEAVVLPQLLYFLERRVAATMFIRYCSGNFPELGRILKDAKPEKVVELLTAQSCAEAVSSDRLEWLGDAVLQMVQTDAVLKSTDLRNWIANLHEGDLDSVRSVMCSNARLTAACNAIGLSQFILTKKLEKGIYVPSGVELVSESGDIMEIETPPADKVRADFIESILAFVYKNSVQNGYASARKVADELMITVPWSEVDKEVSDEYSQSRTAKLLERTKAVTAYSSFCNPLLLQQAFTHQTNPCKRTSSNQKLEWIGDACLCLAVREYIYDNYPNAEAGKMVLLETPMVANSSLAFLSLMYGLHKLLDHRDSTLPGRIESYAYSVFELEKGLFSSDPPKCIADVVESLIGAVFMDGGWEAGRKAALKIVSPIISLYRASQSPGDFNFHPKRSLLEFGGDVISMATVSDKVTGGVRGSIACLGVELASISDISGPAAIDRGSALVLSVFRKNKSLKNDFLSARRRMLNAVASMGKVDKNSVADQEDQEEQWK